MTRLNLNRAARLRRALAAACMAGICAMATAQQGTAATAQQGAAATAQQGKAAAPQQDQITITQAAGTGEAKARQELQLMFAALGGDRWANRGDYIVQGHTSSFYKGSPTGVTEYLQFHHVYPDGTYADRAELTKKRDIVQLWTPTTGWELTYKGATQLPKEQQVEYFSRQPYTLDNIYRVWLKDPQVLYIFGGTSVIARREAESVTLIDSHNNAVTIDIELSTHLPLRRTFKQRNVQYKDFDEDQEEYSDFHEVAGIPTPYVTTRYHDGDMVSQRFVQHLEFRANDPGLFTPQAIIGKHK